MEHRPEAPSSSRKPPTQHHVAAPRRGGRRKQPEAGTPLLADMSLTTSSVGSFEPSKPQGKKKKKSGSSGKKKSSDRQGRSRQFSVVRSYASLSPSRVRRSAGVLPQQQPEDEPSSVASGSTRGRSSPAPPATAAATPIPASKIQSIRDVYGPHADLYRDVLLLPQPEAVTPATLRTAYFRRARQVLTTPKQPSLPKQPSPVSATANVNDYQHDDDAAMAPTAKDRFQAVTKAFEILSNPSWKAYYQEHGLEVEMVEAAAAAAEPSQLVDLLLDNNDYPLPPGAARPILKRRSRSWGPVVSRRSSRTSRLRWNEEVEELVYLPESSENEDDEEEEAQQADGAGSGSSNRRSKKKKKKRHKPVIVIENNPEELFAEHELEDGYTHDFLDDIEASLDGLGANLGGLVQKYADSINSFSSKQDDDDDDDSCKYTTLSSKGEEQEQPSKEQQQGEDKTQAATTGKTSSRLGRAANKEQSQQSEMESDDSETEQKMLVKDLLAGFTKPPPIIDSNQLELDEEQQECERLQEQTNKETGGTQASLSLSASSSGETAKKAEEKKKLAPPRERKAKERRLEASSASVGEKLKAEKKSVVATSKDEEHEVVLMSAESSFASTTPQVETKEEKSARAATASSSVKEEGPAKSPRGKLKPLVKKKTTVKVVPIEAFDPFESDSVAVISGIAFDGEEEQGQVKSRESPSPPPYHHLATDAKNQKNEIATDAAAAAEQEDNSAANAWTTEPKFGQSARMRPVLSSRTSRDFDIPRDSSILAASSVGSATENGKSKTTYSLKTNIAVSTPSKDGASVNVLKAFSFDSALNTTLGDDTIFADLSRSAEDATQELKSSMDSKTKDFKSAMESRTKDFKSAMGTSANAFVSSSTEVARQLQGMFDGVAKQAEGVAKQAEESFRAISPGPVQDARQDAESARASASPEPTTVGSGVSSGANGEGTVPPEGEGSLFDAFNRYIKSLAQDVGLLGIVFNENVAEANRTMVDSFVVPEEEMDGMLHVLETELNASRNDDRITKSFTY